MGNNLKLVSLRDVKGGKLVPVDCVLLEDDNSLNLVKQYRKCSTCYLAVLSHLMKKQLFFLYTAVQRRVVKT